MECNDLEGFSAIAIDHAIHPRNNGKLKEFNGYGSISGPCQDTMEFWLLINRGRVDRSSFATDGCYSSLACGSMLTSLIQDKTVNEITSIDKKTILDALGGLSSEHEHCAVLAIMALQASYDNFLHNTKKSKQTTESNCDTCGEKTCSAHDRNEDENDEEYEERKKLQSKLCRIKHKIIVMSGKGGVGKSTIAVNIAAALMMSGKSVGLLDVDLHGPSIPTMLGIEQQLMYSNEDGLIPVEVNGIKVISMGFFLKKQTDAVIWRGPLKASIIKQFIKDVVWGDLDYLIIDSPPGTGDEPLSVCQTIKPMDGAIIVTTPQKVAEVDVRKSITFCRELGLPLIGLIENMSGFVCPKCGEVTHILSSGAGERIAKEMDIPLLDSIPINQGIAEACDNGKAYVSSNTNSTVSVTMQNVVKHIIAVSEIQS